MKLTFLINKYNLKLRRILGKYLYEIIYNQYLLTKVTLMQINKLIMSEIVKSIKIHSVAACCRNNGIGKNGDLAWRLKYVF